MFSFAADSTSTASRNSLGARKHRLGASSKIFLQALPASSQLRRNARTTQWEILQFPHPAFAEKAQQGSDTLSNWITILVIDPPPLAAAAHVLKEIDPHSKRVDNTDTVTQETCSDSDGGGILRTTRAVSAPSGSTSQQTPSLEIFSVQRAHRSSSAKSDGMCRLSAFVDDFAFEDGDPCLLSPVDPLFLLLPHLASTDVMRSFCRVSDAISTSTRKFLLETEESCERHRLLCASLMRIVTSANASPRLHLVADMQECGGDVYYRLNTEKLSKFLSAKVDNMERTACRQEIVLSECTAVLRCESDNPVRSGQRTETDKGELRRLCWDLVRCMLPPKLQDEVGKLRDWPWRVPTALLPGGGGGGCGMASNSPRKRPLNIGNPPNAKRAKVQVTKKSSAGNGGGIRAFFSSLKK